MSLMFLISLPSNKAGSLPPITGIDPFSFESVACSYGSSVVQERGGKREREREREREGRIEREREREREKKKKNQGCLTKLGGTPNHY